MRVRFLVSLPMLALLVLTLSACRIGDPAAPTATSPPPARPAVTFVEEIALDNHPGAASRLPIEAGGQFGILIEVQQQADEWVSCGNPRVIDPFGNELVELTPIDPTPTFAIYEYADFAGSTGVFEVRFDSSECDVRRTASEATVVWSAPPLVPLAEPSSAIHMVGEYLGNDDYPDRDSLRIFDPRRAPREITVGQACNSAVVPLVALDADGYAWCASAAGIAIVGGVIPELDRVDAEHALGDAGYQPGEYNGFDYWRRHDAGVGETRSVAFTEAAVVVGMEDRVKGVLRNLTEPSQQLVQDQLFAFVAAEIFDGYAFRLSKSTSHPGGWAWADLGHGIIVRHQVSQVSFTSEAEAAEAEADLRDRFHYDVQRDGTLVRFQQRTLFPRDTFLSRVVAELPSLDPFE